MLTTIAFQLFVGLGLLALGRWSLARVDTLVPAALPEDERDRRTGVLVRGAWACQVIGIVFILAIVPVFLS